MQVRQALVRNVFVAIDINCTEANFASYASRSADQKIALLKAKIREISETLKIKEPGSRVIIGYREYGITESTSRAVAREVEIALEKYMRKLVRQYPNITILTGAMAVYKIKNKDVLAQLSIEYKHNIYFNYIREKEKKLNHPDNQQIDWHENQINELKKQPDNQDVYVTRTSATIISNDHAFRHDKIAPYYETQEKNLTRIALKPPKYRHPFFTLCGHDLPPLHIHLDLCRENPLGINEQSATPSDVYVLMSDSQALSFEHIHAKYAFTLDSIFRPALIVVDPEDTENHLSANDIVLYTSNLLETKSELKGPYRPISHFAGLILTVLDNEIYYHAGMKMRLSHLQDMRDTFAEAAQVDSDEALCEVLRSQLMLRQAALKTKTKTLSCCGLFEFKMPLAELDRNLNKTLDWLYETILAQEQKISKQSFTL